MSIGFDAGLLMLPQSSGSLKQEVQMKTSVKRTIVRLGKVTSRTEAVLPKPALEFGSPTFGYPD